MQPTSHPNLRHSCGKFDEQNFAKTGRRGGTQIAEMPVDSFPLPTLDQAEAYRARRAAVGQSANTDARRGRPPHSRL
jgi:hypothetical protein